MQMPRFALVFSLLSASLLTACPAPTPPVDAPDITSFRAEPSGVGFGDSSTLSWSVTGEDVTLRIDNGVGTVTGASVSVSPTETTRYTLTATNSSGRDTATTKVTVTLDPPAIAAFTATPASIIAGDSVTLAWAVTGDALSLSIDQDVGVVTGESLTLALSETTVYTLTAANSAGSASASVSVTVNAPPFIVSTFDGTSDEKWTINNALPTNPGEGGSGGGAGNGYITSMPATNGLTSYYVAPLKYHTTWLEYSEISFDILSSGGDYYTGEGAPRGDVHLANGSLTARYLLPKRPGPEWESFVVPLADGAWTFGGGATSLSDILGRVTDFQIRAEYGRGPDSSSLDNVRVGPGEQ